MPALRPIMLLVLSLLTTACATTPSLTPAQAQQRALTAQKLEALQHWRLNASIAAHGEEGAWDARVLWQQAGNQYRIDLYGPLGQGAIHLAGDPSGVTLDTAEGKRYQAHDPDNLLRNNTGLILPLKQLYYWIRGLPAPDTQVSAAEYNAQIDLQTLTQNGWHISYVKYMEQDGLRLPKKLNLQNDDYYARIVISNWQPGAVTFTP